MLEWVFINQRTTAAFTSDIMSANFSFGRQTYMDTYSGSSLRFTIKNQNQQANTFQMNDVIEVKVTGSTFEGRFWVDEIQYQDYPGNTGLSTATVVCSDAMTRLGRKLVTKTLTQDYCVVQASQLNTVGELPAVVGYASSYMGSVASAATFSGSPLTRINELISTDRGILRHNEEYVLFYDRNYINNSVFQSDIKFGRTADVATKRIAYEEFTRTALGLNFMNNVTVTPTGGAEQTGINQPSVDLYESAYYSVQTVDATNAQGLGLANWLANSQSDPNALRFEISFNDRSQNVGLLEDWMDSLDLPSSYLLSYRVPGTGSDTQAYVVMEGYEVDITPSVSRFRVSFSPLTLYAFFTLNSPVYGVLDSSRLGW